MDALSWKIQVGDTVTVDFMGDGSVLTIGVVRYTPCATGDSWIIENDYGVHYVQQFASMTRKKEA